MMDCISLIKTFIPNTLLIRLRSVRNSARSQKYKLIKDPYSIFKVVYHIKDETWESMYSPEIFNSAKERVVTALYPAEDIFLVKEAIVGCESDAIITEDGVWWDKYYDDDFLATALPYDSNVFTFDKDSICIIKRKNTVYLHGTTLSLVGVFSYAWSHFLFQFLCKLYFAMEAGILSENITLLVDKTNDNNIEEIINGILNQYPKVKKLYADPTTDYKCERLYCMRSTSSNYNEMRYWLDHRQITPQNVMENIDKYLVNPLVEKIKDNPVKHKKLFLPRRSNRRLNNNSEVENYFKNQGFFFVEALELSLLEKTDLFYHAEIIVGLHGSAWQNTIFCNNAKCLMLCNNRFITESIFSSMARSKTKYWLNVSGSDDSDERRSNFTIPLEKIKVAYEQLLNM